MATWVQSGIYRLLIGLVLDAAQKFEKEQKLLQVPFVDPTIKSTTFFQDHRAQRFATTCNRNKTGFHKRTSRDADNRISFFSFPSFSFNLSYAIYIAQMLHTLQQNISRRYSETAWPTGARSQYSTVLHWMDIVVGWNLRGWLGERASGRSACSLRVHRTFGWPGQHKTALLRIAEDRQGNGYQRILTPGTRFCGCQTILHDSM